MLGGIVLLQNLSFNAGAGGQEQILQGRTLCSVGIVLQPVSWGQFFAGEMSAQSENVLIVQSRNVLLDSGTLLMTQKDRDRLVALKKAKKGLITQRQAAEEMDKANGMSGGC